METSGEGKEKLGRGRPERRSVMAVWPPEPASTTGPGVCWTRQQPGRCGAEERARGKLDRNPSCAGRTIPVISPVQLQLTRLKSVQLLPIVRASLISHQRQLQPGSSRRYCVRRRNLACMSGGEGDHYCHC